MKYDRTKDDHAIISDNLRAQILDAGFVTGSKVFGGFNPFKSDIDVCLPPIDGMRFKDLMHEGWFWHEYADFDEFKNLYMKTSKGEVLNVLFFNDRNDWLEWKTTTGQFLKIIGASKLISKAVAEKKEARVTLFEAIRLTLFGHHAKKDVDPPF